MSDGIVDGPEWRVYEDGVKGLPRASGPVTMLRHDQGIGVGNTVLERDKWLVTILMELSSLCSRLNPPRVVCESAGAIIHRLRGHTGRGGEQRLATLKRALAAAALAEAVRLHNVGVSVGDIMAVAGVGEAELWDATVLLSSAGALVHPRHSLPDRVAVLAAATAARLGLPPDVILVSGRIARQLFSHDFRPPVYARPSVAAAAIVYLVARLHGYRVTQEEAARAMHTTEARLRATLWRITSGMVIMVEV